MKKSKINIEKLIEAQEKGWKAFGEGLENSSLSLEDIQSLQKSLSEVELQAYKTKLGFEIHIFSKTGEQLTSRDFLLKMLGNLPKEVPVNFLPALTEYVLENWVAMNRKVAA